ncbi:MAG: hypothetical protein KME64_37700 [Scytonematopsis contorta HA4267-MV1]|jgi:hypothetical protein|nr:hypothetical protein [Scytonematopsis contorta HA4267-MV1]
MRKIEKIINIGDKFGSWTVLEVNGLKCLCECSCGTQKLVNSYSLIKNKSKSCGCLKKTPSILPQTRFGRLTVLHSPEKKGKYGQILVPTKCDCGNEKLIYKSSLINGKTTSCGCWSKEVASRGTHYKSRTREYYVWLNIKSACYNQNNPEYWKYGGQGIKLDDSWKNNFQQFLADVGEAPPDSIFARIDRNGNFCPENCAWVNRQEKYLLNIGKKPRTGVIAKLPDRIIQSVLKTHTEGEANVNRIAEKFDISSKIVMNIILNYT